MFLKFKIHISDDRECNSNAENASPERMKSYKIISNVNVYIYVDMLVSIHRSIQTISPVQAKQFECAVWGKRHIRIGTSCILYI